MSLPQHLIIPTALLPQAPTHLRPFGAFPLDLHSHIALYADRPSLLACCHVSKTFLEIYGKQLYTHVFVQGIDALYQLFQPPVSSFLLQPPFLRFPLFILALFQDPALPLYMRNTFSLKWAKSFELFQPAKCPPTSPLRQLNLSDARLNAPMAIKTLTLQATNQMLDSFGAVIHKPAPLACVSFLDSFFLLFDPVCVRVVNLGRRICVLRLRLILDTPSRLVWPRLTRFCTHFIVLPHLKHHPAPNNVPCTLVFELDSVSAPKRDSSLNLTIALYNVFPSHNFDLGIAFPSQRFPTAEVIVQGRESLAYTQTRLNDRAKKYYTAQEAADRLRLVSVLAPDFHP